MVLVIAPAVQPARLWLNWTVVQVLRATFERGVSVCSRRFLDIAGDASRIAAFLGSDLYMILYGKTGEPAKCAHRAYSVFNNLRVFNIWTESDSDPRLQLKQKGSHLNSVVCDCCWILPYHSRASPFLPHFARQQPENRHRQPNRPPNASATSAGRPFL